MNKTFIYENDEQLQQALAEWQKILRLQDWIIKASIRRERDMYLANSSAAVRYNYEKRMAFIHIMDPIDYEPDLMVPQDMEISLVHELLHLHYAGFDQTEKGTIEYALVEQSIEAISRALVELKRSGQR